MEHCHIVNSNALNRNNAPKAFFIQYMDVQPCKFLNSLVDSTGCLVRAGFLVRNVHFKVTQMDNNFDFYIFLPQYND